MARSVSRREAHGWCGRLLTWWSGHSCHTHHWDARVHFPPISNLLHIVMMTMMMMATMSFLIPCHTVAASETSRDDGLPGPECLCRLGQTRFSAPPGRATWHRARNPRNATCPIFTVREWPSSRIHGVISTQRHPLAEVCNTVQDLWGCTSSLSRLGCFRTRSERHTASITLGHAASRQPRSCQAQICRQEEDSFFIQSQYRRRLHRYVQNGSRTQHSRDWSW